jgi:hypothetical protein
MKADSLVLRERFTCHTSRFIRSEPCTCGWARLNLITSLFGAQKRMVITAESSCASASERRLRGHSCHRNSDSPGELRPELYQNELLFAQHQRDCLSGPSRAHLPDRPNATDRLSITSASAGCHRHHHHNNGCRRPRQHVRRL